jgi:hypothetical protein
MSSRPFIQLWFAGVLVAAGAAAESHCRFLVDSNGQLVVKNEEGVSLATLGKGAQGRWIAAWSPDGTRILYSAFPRTEGDTLYVNLAGANGDEEGALRVTAPEPRDWDVRWIGDLHWLDDSRFWYDGTLGHHGGYIDVWAIASDFARSELESRLAVLGGGCSLSPDRAVVACITEDVMSSAIAVFDYGRATKGGPLPQVPVPDEYDVYVFSRQSSGSRDAAHVEGDLYWGRGGRELAFAVRRGERLELRTLQRHGAGTKGWKPTLREVTGVRGTIEDIREREGAYEFATEEGIFRIREQTGKTAVGATVAALAAEHLSQPEAIFPPHTPKTSVLGRWCFGDR